MKKYKKTIYLGAWITYIVVSFYGYPYLRVTVMLLSIPLTMLGAWFYSYKGAVSTSLLTIPYHALMLRYYSDDPTILIEALNPLGISSQLFFSCWTAMLRSNRERYRKLNDSLEEIVEEQTSDLRLFTEYLMDIEELERGNLSRILLDVPNKELRAMLNTCSLLETQPSDIDHTGLKKVKTIEGLIQECLKHLKTLGELPESSLSGTFDIHDELTQLTSHLQNISGVNIQLIGESDWNHFTPTAAPDVYSIIHEALTNALRHGSPSNIIIAAANTPETQTFYIEDDGEKTQDAKDAGIGLALMKRRASRIGATFSFDSAPETPTRVKCVIPFANAI